VVLGLIGNPSNQKIEEQLEQEVNPRITSPASRSRSNARGQIIAVLATDNDSRVFVPSEETCTLIGVPGARFTGGMNDKATVRLADAIKAITAIPWIQAVNRPSRAIRVTSARSAHKSCR